MNSRNASALDSALSDPAEKPFRMLTVYDSDRANAEAQSAADLVLRELGDDILVVQDSWLITFLETFADSKLAAQEATRADIILFALSETVPSAAFKNWIAQWERSRVVDGGLLALIPTCAAEAESDLAAFLYETAVSAQMDFLCRKLRRH